MAILQSRRLDVAEIPVIDLAPLVAGEDAADTVAAIGRACREVGFLYVKNHGVCPTLVQRLLAAARDFFDRPMAEKMTLCLDQRMRGYLPLGYRSYEGEARAATSHQEGFWVGHERPLDTANRLDGPNLWPADSDALQRAMLAYFAAAEDLGVVLQRAFALALGLDPAFFQRRFERPQTLLKLNHYPPQDRPERESDIGVVPHSDSGGFTILWQDDKGGLEIQSRNGEWVAAPPVADSFVINLGNVMQVWTDGAFSSTPHRVINRSGTERYSIPLFVNPRWDVPVAPLIGPGAGTEPAVRYETYQRDIWRRTFPIARIPD